MEENNFFNSKKFTKIVLGLVMFGLLFSAFRVGELVGFKKASFSFKWGENYYLNAAGPGPHMFDMDAQYFMPAHGVAGKIMGISSTSIVLTDRENLEREVIVDDDTEFFIFRNRIPFSDLKTGDAATVIGSPEDSGMIRAKLIRLLPPNAGFIRIQTR
ncbi:MAG: Uncharacterized protein LiPW15_207 [Parcubacteria group bacterium LiPW_15]|nr:MAG: Uncharacterized protein LiPW15_207 [Parcubacteria group bacterium LiPW_15]